MVSSTASINGLLEAWAERTPEAIAVDFHRRVLTYRELDCLADRLAGELRRLGAGPEERVGVWLPRSPELVIGLLGILKSGAAYVPVDPECPPERLRLLLRQAGADLFLAAPAAVAAAPSGVRVVPLDKLTSLPDVPRQSSGVGPEGLAYAMFTSGSTGTPKCIGVPHRAVVRLVTDTDYLRLHPGDRLAHASSPAFDASTFEIWGALLSGATLVGVTKDEVLSPVRLRARLSEAGVTVMFLTTALFNRLVAEEPALFSSLRCLLFGGETVDPRRVRQVLDSGPPQRLLHMYGPTETTTFASWHAVGAVLEGATVPIGKAIAGARLLVLDRHLQPVKVGEVGELCIGGELLARGYLGRPGTTAARFLPDPFSGEPGARLYRTGDLVRLRDDGDLEFLGRSDAQVKLRGYRIELGEIESALAAHPLVEHAAATVAEVGGGERRLVAYVVPRGGAIPDTEELRAFLAARLPSYMVPSGMARLDALPLTPNGKIDRDALPELDTRHDRVAEPPASPVEERLAEIWREVLGVDQVGRADSFLALGGHSLMAMQFVGRARAAFGVEPRVQDLLDPTFTLTALARQLEDASPEPPPPAPAPAAPRRPDGQAPLSGSQESVWFMHELDADSLAYDFQSLLRLEGRLDVVALRAALDAVIRRHDAYRTTFHTDGGRPYQRVHESGAAAMRVVDLEGVEPDQRERSAWEVVEAEIRRPFDVERLPLVRWTLVRLGPDRHWLLHAEHHLVHDGWSFLVFVRDLLELYAARVEGRQPDLPPLPLPFSGYAARQQELLRQPAANDTLRYWKDRLAGRPDAIRLPADHPRPSARSFRGAGHRTNLPSGLRAAVESLARRERTTPFVVMLAAFVALLHRYSGQSDLVVGSAVANRLIPETRDLIGMLVDTLPLRFEVGGDPTFSELLRRVHAAVAADLGRGTVPFHRIVEAVAGLRDLSRNPLFDICFSFHDTPMPSTRAPDLTVELAEGLSNGSAKFDLDVVVIPGTERRLPAAGPEGYTLIWEFSTDLFEPATIERMNGHYRTLLETATERPRERVSDLPLVGTAELRQLLLEWNDTGVTWPGPDQLHELIEQQGAANPEATAVECGPFTLSYGELGRQAARLARHLRGLGVGTETPVGIFVDRSPELIVALLGVLRAGAAFVPLDLDHPPARLSRILEDLAIPVVVTSRRRAEALPAHGASLVRVDADLAAEEPAAPAADAPAVAAPAVAAQPDNLAYVVHTSGSTGEPKGVCITHRAVCNHARSVVRIFGLRPGERALQFASVSFDTAYEEIFATLAAGATLVLLPGGPPSPAELVDLLQTLRVDVLNLPTSYWEQLLREAPLDGFRPQQRPRLVVIGGEALSTAGAARQQEILHAGVDVVNTYGPTECTITATSCPLEPAEDGDLRAPIGRPIANTRAYVLDEALRPVPIGVVGELCIGGVGLARGYWREPGLTAERFVPDPFGARGARLYRTGDLARFLPDGSLEFAGRTDDQVKVRGFRIELGEVETVLARHPAVAQAAARVIGSDGEPDSRRLIAYAVPEAGAAIEPDVLREGLRRRLPAFMVPSAVQLIDSLPLTERGKLDRAALPEPEPPGQAGAGLAAPRTPEEEALARIWQEVLGVERVGINDDLFELGGHSLLAMQLVGRVRTALGVPLSLRLVFEHPTVAELARIVEELRSHAG